MASMQTLSSLQSPYPYAVFSKSDLADCVLILDGASPKDIVQDYCDRKIDRVISKSEMATLKVEIDNGQSRYDFLLEDWADAPFREAVLGHISSQIQNALLRPDICKEGRMPWSSQDKEEGAAHLLFRHDIMGRPPGTWTVTRLKQTPEACRKAVEHDPSAHT